MTSKQHERVNSLGYVNNVCPNIPGMQVGTYSLPVKGYVNQKTPDMGMFQAGQGKFGAKYNKQSNKQDNPSVTNQMSNSAMNPIINNPIFGKYVGPTQLPEKYQSGNFGQQNPCNRFSQI